MMLLEGYDLTQSPRFSHASYYPLFRMGLCAGLGYGIDFGAGASLVLITTIFIAYQCRTIASLLALGIGMIPPIAVYHGINYVIGGTILPANTHVAYLDFPGSPFTLANATGDWKHSSFIKFLLYSADLLWGKRGFIEHNVPLLLLCVAGFSLVRSSFPERKILVFGFSWSLLTWLVYATGSNNLSGIVIRFGGLFRFWRPAISRWPSFFAIGPNGDPHLFFCQGGEASWRALVGGKVRGAWIWFPCIGASSRESS